MTSEIQRLLDIMARLRDPESGCPWDIEQTFETIAPHTLEETYELIEAIEAGDKVAIKEELGDVLLQVVFHAQMAREAGMFDFEDVAKGISDKLIERHPHIFSDRNAHTAQDVLANWEKDKAAKRAQAAGETGRAAGALDGVSAALPAATRAVKLQKRAARVGFDWAEAKDVLNKIEEEIGEFRDELCRDPASRDVSALEEELGDVFFAIVNLARKLDIDPETALRRTNRKFERRFKGIEEALAQKGRKVMDASLDEMEAIWNEIKKQEKFIPPRL